MDSGSTHYRFWDWTRTVVHQLVTPFSCKPNFVIAVINQQRKTLTLLSSLNCTNITEFHLPWRLALFSINLTFRHSFYKVRPFSLQLLLFRSVDVSERKLWSLCCLVRIVIPPSIFALTFCGSGGGAWRLWASARGGKQLWCQHWTSNQHCCKALQDWIPKPYVSQVLCRSPHLEPCKRDTVIMFWQELLHICLPSLHSKMDSKLQRRPRSTSMKDRQNSKAQSDRTSSMDSECSPDSRVIAQVICYSIYFFKFYECCLKCLEHSMPV